MSEYNPALPVHPRTGLAAIGVLPSGRVVWPVLGGSGEDDVIVQDADLDVEPDADVEPLDDDDPADEPGKDDDEPLREAGVKALAAEKVRRRAAARLHREAARERDDALAELDALRKAAERKADGDEPDAGPDLDAIRAEAADKAKAEARAEILAERVSDRIEVLAAKRFQNAEDALAQLMRTSDVEDFLDGDKIDAGAIKEALDELLEKKPYLAVAAQSAKRFQGSGDGGARKGPTGPSQLTEDDLKRMTPEAIVKAHEQGRFNGLLGTPQ